MLTRANPLGWVLGDKLEPTQINQIDEQIARAIDGVDGGAYSLAQPLVIDGFVSIDGTVALNGNVGGQWSPAQPILIGAAGLRVSGATLEVAQTGTLHVSAGSSLVVNGTGSVFRIGLSGAGELTNGADFTAKAGSSFIVEKNASIELTEGRINVFAGRIQLDATSSVRGANTGDGSLDLGTVLARTSLTSHGPIVKNGSAAYVRERVVPLPAESVALPALAGDLYVIATTGMTGDITITLPALTSDDDGRLVRFVQHTHATGHEVSFAGTAHVAVTSSGQGFSAAFVWEALTGWILADFSTWTTANQV